MTNATSASGRKATLSGRRRPSGAGLGRDRRRLGRASREGCSPCSLLHDGGHLLVERGLRELAELARPIVPSRPMKKVSGGPRMP